MNLPQLTAQLGALERSGQDVLHSLVKPLKFKRKENESYYAVYLTIDLAQDSIVFENPFPYDESLLKRIYYFGNNSAAASQTYLVRSTDSLHYLLTSVWNDLYISLQQNGMSASRLAQLLQHLHSRSFVSLGSKKGQGRLVLEKIRFPAALAGPSISYNPDEKCVVINDIKYKSEAFLNLLLENENKKNRVVLIIPKIRDGHEEYLLSQHEDYHELVKKINKLDDNHSAAENLRDGGRVCYLCHQVKPDVSSSYSTKFSRSGINKIFTITTINAARFNRDGYSYDDSYSICGSCYQDLITGEKVVESQFRGRIAGESVFILPEHLLESFDYSSIGAIKKDMDIAFNSFEINEWLTAVENDASWLSSNLYMVHFIIYRTDGNSVSILEAIEDVPTLRIVRIMKLLRDYANRVKPHIKGLSLASIYRMIPVRETEKGQIDIGRVLSLYKAILSGELIRTETLYGYACEALDKGMRQLHKARMDNYRNLNLIQYANGREDYFIKSTVLSYVVLLQTSVGVLCILIIYLAYLNDIIMKPMNNLIRGMRRIKHGNWDTRLHSSGSKEFAIINETFNSMASQIHELKISVYEEQIKAHKAELKHLQLQINPHFLLNSINIVYNLAEIKNYSVIQLMCMNLVKYFRFTTKTNQIVVTIAEEMEHMESYIKIQQVRFPGRVTYEIHISDGAEKAAIPPLLIQPFIENAIKYGFDFMDHPFHIAIYIRLLEHERLEIVISDNGNGFSEEILEKLQTGGYLESQNGEHLGISNVQYRLKHIFGQQTQLEFDNAPDSGARIRIALPFRTVEKFTSY